MLLIFIVLYLGLTLLIGWWASKRVKSTQDFVVAGRQLPLIVAASALFATWFGSETVMGASSEFVNHGLIGVIEDPFGAALCLLLVGVFFARPLYRMNILTLNDFFRIRFSRATEFMSAIFMVPSYFGWIAAQLLAMAFILQTLTGIPFLYNITICTMLVMGYTYIGGMWAVSITDFVQTIIIILGLLFFAIQLLLEVGGWTRLMEHTPEGFFYILPEPNPIDISHYFAAWITIGLGSIPQQDVFQRVMSAKSEKVAVKASYLGALMYLVIALLPLMIGLCGQILYPELLKNDPQKFLPELVLQHGSLVLQIFVFGALLSAIMSTTSGAILAPATVLGENIIRPYFKQINDQQLLKIMRFSVIIVAIISAILASLKSNIYELVGQSSAFSLVSLFVPLVAGLWWKNASNTGAMVSMIVGMIAWVYCEFVGTEAPGLLYGLLASALGMLLGSWFFPQKQYSA